MNRKQAWNTAIIFLVFVLLYNAEETGATGLNCSIEYNSSCSFTRVIGLKNDTWGYFNAHAQNASVNTYNYTLCCDANVVSDNISISCSDSTLFRLWSQSNSHVQKNNYTEYNVTACMSADYGKTYCNYETGSCTAPYNCILSMASSEAEYNNNSNAHVGPCSQYDQKLCCYLDSAPTHSSPILNATDHPLNRTTANLTCYNQSTEEWENSSVSNIYNWYVNGSSILELNIPFDTNRSDNITIDYSNNQNGSLNGPIWNAGGKIGGAYDFDGTDFISFSNINLSEGLSLEAWISTDDWGSGSIKDIIDSWSAGANADWYRLGIASSGDVEFVVDTGDDDGGRESVKYKTSGYSGWHHLVGVRDYNALNLKLYIDGSQVNSSPFSGTTAILPTTLKIGARGDGAAEFFNGTIDEVRIYGRALSPEQVIMNYNGGAGRVNSIASNETVKTESWKCDITPTDRSNDGLVKSSNEIIIQNTPPEPVSLYSPNTSTTITNRTPTFIWNESTDKDNDKIWYELTVLCKPGCSIDNKVIANITATNHTLSDELNYFWDDNYYYEWYVRAFDNVSYSINSSVRSFSLQSLVAISLKNSTMDFGNMTLGQANDTTDDNPSPFVVQNDGNSVININISLDGQGIWDAEASPTSKFRYKIDNSSELNSFNWSSSQTNWTNIPLSNKTVISWLNYTNNNDTVEVDVYLQVPLDEPEGVKNTTILFTGAYVSTT